MNASLPAVLGFPHLQPPPPGEVIPVADGVRWLRMPLPFALDHINLWLVADGDGWTQVDCGYGDGATRSLWETHFDCTLAGRPLHRVVATHYHPDHLGNAAWLTQRFDCPLVMSQTEFLTAHMAGNAHAGHDIAATCALFRAHGMNAEQLAEMAMRGNRYRRGVPELPATFRRMLPGDEIEIGQHRWRAIGGYGHSPEHVSLHCEQLSVCISGDMLLPKITTNVSVWPTEPDGDPLTRFLNSLPVFAALPPETLMLPSHGLPFIGAGLRVDQLRGHHATRLTELEAAAATPKTAAELLPILFRRALDVQQRFFAMGEAIAHLNHLWRARRLARTIADDGTIRFGRST